MKICTLCLDPIGDNEDFCKEVAGWVGGPKKDSMRLRADTGNFAHERCVAVMAAGQDPTQPDLFAVDNKIENAAIQNTATISNLEDLL